MSIIEKNGVTRLRGYIHGSHLVMGVTVGWVLGVRPMTMYQVDIICVTGRKDTHVP